MKTQEEIIEIIKKYSLEIKEYFPDFRKKRGVRYSFELIIRMIVASIVNGIIDLNKMKDFISSTSMAKHIEDLDYKGKRPKIGCLRIVILHIPEDLLLRLNKEIIIIKQPEQKIENNVIKSSIISLNEDKNNVIQYSKTECVLELETKKKDVLLNLEDKINKISEIKNQEINQFNGKALAFDGKAVKSGHSYFEKAPMYLNGVFCDTGIPFMQALVDKKTNEIPIFIKATKLLDLSGYLCTLDVLHTQIKTVEYIYEEKKGHYLLTVKWNQKKLLNMIKEEQLIDSVHDFETVEKGHGRIEIRRIWVKEAPVSIEKKFPHTKQIVVIERISEHLSDGKVIKTTQEFCYCVTSLSSEQASPADLLRYNRQHWAIENKLHYVLDVTFNEDKCRCYKIEMVSAMTMLRKIAINIYRNSGITNIASGVRIINFA